MAYCGQMQPQAYRQHLVEELEGEGEGEGVGAGPGGGGHIQLHPEQRRQLPAGTPDIQLDAQLVYSYLSMSLSSSRNQSRLE